MTSGVESSFTLTGAPAGRYRLGLGMVEANGVDRAPIVNAQGEGLPSGRLVLEPIVTGQ